MSTFGYLLAFLMLVTSSAVVQGEFKCACGDLCPEGWYLWKGYCYIKLSNRTWHEAISECHKFESYMATPHSKEETNHLQSMEKSFWINCIDIHMEGRWDCCDGTKSAYTDWDEREPNNLIDEDCATVQESGRWNDSDCEEEAPSFCKKPVECLH